MWLLLRAFVLCLVAAVAFITFSIPLTLHAASASLPNGDKVPLCDGNLTVMPWLWICTSESKGVTRYRIDAANGAHVELVASKDDLNVQQKTGPDTIRVPLVTAPAPSSSSALPAPHMVNRVYQDAHLVIDEVQDGQHQLPTWVIYPRNSRHVPSRQEILCTGSSCSGHIVVKP